MAWEQSLEALPFMGGSNHPLIDIIAVANIGILSSGNDWVNVVKWANAYIGWFQSVGLCLNGVPSHDTIGRFFRIVDPKAFEA